MPHSQQTSRRWEDWTFSHKHRRPRRQSKTLGLLTPDRIGDHLVARCMALDNFRARNLSKMWLPEVLQGSRMTFGSRQVFQGIVNAVSDQIDAVITYENESNVLVQLAQTGYIVQQISKLNRLLDVALTVYNIKEPHSMKHGDDTYTDLEGDVISDVYDTCVNLSGLTVVTVPEWLVPAHEIRQNRWQDTEVKVEKLMNRNEEFCIRQASAWWNLHHPHVMKLFGACHVGNDLFLVHESAQSVNKSVSSRDVVLGTARILQLLHERYVVPTKLTVERLSSNKCGFQETTADN
ncbi:hypothetical protein GN244_ATG09244 [Phytophthora infestans]|uniref:Protein kinase n=1 Tax=Phytophthora infestans TaxID=4787 RepID=A0A833T8R0_PHYIN|nr:hypothetical protein GN244_ATG09244 [Phytophthora infestans]